MSVIPDFLKQGEIARLFPVLATTSKEGRATSILLACMSRIGELGKALLLPLGQRLGSRANIETYTEVVFKGQGAEIKERPDGLIIVRVGSREWRAIVEAKVGNNELTAEQIERYQAIAKNHNIDCVITISNQFATSPENHPLPQIQKSKSKIPVYHWSWMHILTTADLLINNEDIADIDQALLLKEFRRFLSHESTGVKGFERMPREWTELNRLVSVGGKIPAKSQEAISVLGAWHQEIRDLSLILSRQTETLVTERLPRKYSKNLALRFKDELSSLRETNCLQGHLDIPNAAGSIEILADLSRRTVEVGITLRAPEDKVSSKARINWLLRQVKSEDLENLYVRLNWPGRSESTHFLLKDVHKDPSLVDKDKEGQQVHSFHIYYAKRFGSRFIQQTNFIVDLENIVPHFYKEIGQNLCKWQVKPPKIKPEKELSVDVSVDAISESEGYIVGDLKTL